MSDPTAALPALLGFPADAPVILTRIEVLDWGRTLVLYGQIGDQPFALRYADCRELRWRIYVHERRDATPVVSFAPGRDQHRSPAQILTAHFGLSLFYGAADYSSRIADRDEC